MPPCFFTASASFANPAVTVSRVHRQFPPDRPQSVALFIAAQFVGAAIGAAFPGVLPSAGVIRSLSIREHEESNDLQTQRPFSSACTTPDALQIAAYLAHLRQRPHRGAVRRLGARRQRQPISRRRHGEEDRRVIGTPKILTCRAVKDSEMS